MTEHELLEKVQRLYTRRGYFDRFFELCAENPTLTYKANWHALEVEYFCLFGCFKYADYASFRKQKSKHITIM